MKLQDLSNLHWQDLLTLVCGKLLGCGISRQTYVFKPDPQFVIKLQVDTDRFQNQREWYVWDQCNCMPEPDALARWLAPCIMISDTGSWLLMKRTEPVTLAQCKNLGRRVPRCFTDFKPANWGLLDGKLVCHDYGTALIETPRGTRKATWWENKST